MKLLCVPLLIVLAVPGFASSGKLTNMVLYQPDVVLKERLGADANPLALYAKKLMTKVDALPDSSVQELLDIVVVVKPGQRVRVWFISSLVSPPDRAALKRELEAIVPLEIWGGPIVFAMVYSFNNAPPRNVQDDHYQPPIPAEWREKAKGSPGSLIVPDGFIPLVWPDEKVRAR